MLKNTIWVAAALSFCAANGAFAQTGLPTTQPNLLQIFREEVKVGHTAEHEKVEMGWPAAFEKAKSPYYYLALVSLTGTPEAWYVSPYESHQALGESMKLERDNSVLGAELSRLSRADSEHLNGTRAIQAIARKELSYGDYPETAKQRYWEVTTFRVRPGREAEFAAAAKAYGAAAKRSGSAVGFRVYQVIAGMPEPTYLVFSSVTSYAEFDKVLTNGQAIMKAANEEEQKAFQKFFTEAVISSDTQRFELNPHMSYVSAEVRGTDPAFWMKKKPVAKTSTSVAPKPGAAPAVAKPGSR